MKEAKDRPPEEVSGDEAFERMKDLTRRVIRVPKEEAIKRQTPGKGHRRPAD